MGTSDLREGPGEALLADLYGTLLESASFETPLQVLAKAFRSHISGLHRQNYDNGECELTLVGALTPSEFASWTEAYSARWSGQNLWMERSLEGFLTQGFQHGEAVVSNAELVQSPYYRHFLDPLDIHFGLGISLGAQGASDVAIASFHRDRRDTGFGGEDLDTVRWLRPHLANAYALHRRLHRGDPQEHSLGAFFDRSARGLVLLDAQAQVLRCNAEAEAVLARLGAIGAGADRGIAFTDPLAKQNVIAAMQRCITTLAPAVVTLVPRNGVVREGVVLHLHTVPQYGSSGTRMMGLGFLSELGPRRERAMDEALIHQALGLTHGEARVALALHEHADVELAARALAITASTARSHIKRIYQKLHVSRQGELILLVERCLAGRTARGD